MLSPSTSWRSGNGGRAGRRFTARKEDTGGGAGLRAGAPFSNFSCVSSTAK